MECRARLERDTRVLRPSERRHRLPCPCASPGFVGGFCISGLIRLDWAELWPFESLVRLALVAKAPSPTIFWLDLV